MGSIAIEEYEETRPARRCQMEMALPRRVRHDMLRMEWDVTQREIAGAVRRNVKVKTQRRTTVNNLGKATQVEEVLESLGRKVKRTLTFQRPISTQVKKLEARHNEAQRLRQQYVLELDMANEYDSPSSVEEEDSNFRIPEVAEEKSVDEQ